MPQQHLDTVLAVTHQHDGGGRTRGAHLPVTLREAVLEEGPSGRLDIVYRSVLLDAAAVLARYPGAVLPPALTVPEEEGAPPRRMRTRGSTQRRAAGTSFPL